MATMKKYASDVKAAKRVLNEAAAALTEMAEEIGSDFCKVVDILDNVNGRIIVSGMGKSGHVGRKIAATLASTGSPSFYVHPTEASHGDMGMITAQDCLIVLSNSGESAELKDLIYHGLRYSIPLVGMSSRMNSTLMRDATAHLLLPSGKESCPMGKAPTTSTTRMMALGDALAVALMERRGFSSDDYRLLHPGGLLGKSLVRVKEIMHNTEHLPLATPHMTILEVSKIISKIGLSCAGIVDKEGQLIGIITDGDLRRHLHLNLSECTAKQIMTKHPKLIQESALAVEAIARMNSDKGKPKFSSIFVKKDKPNDDNKPIGILHIHDCLKAGIF
mmetsp:Transcript_8660/g.11990  ORF Transcript_8660/g.11990 Transcript_8660/m.11990 type:complete len:333 (-) Transcript_8660:318-1316(-)|eukprot:CAMPEP_0185723842 /NCGR_PEP_ID=MMETSP1171-20130828/543_1 /TAXON_ID=374046 /ORGANISM="Helicotheca tamensis, Strain CCMP826" /LENGTH=332 /DNA_ID=CAMNT_0028391597 /DNA_START=44 /DNA_END=1042 /DNA_ORIENTATION=+